MVVTANMFIWLWAQLRPPFSQSRNRVPKAIYGDDDGGQKKMVETDGPGTAAKNGYIVAHFDSDLCLHLVYRA